jgi:hypothetical protein
MWISSLPIRAAWPTCFKNMDYVTALALHNRKAFHSWFLASTRAGRCFLTLLAAVSLLQAFCHLERNENATNTCYTTSLSGSDRLIRRCCEAARNHACAWKSLLPLCSVSPPFPHYLPREKYSRILFGQTSCILFLTIPLHIFTSDQQHRIDNIVWNFKQEASIRFSEVLIKGAMLN